MKVLTVTLSLCGLCLVGCAPRATLAPSAAGQSHEMFAPVEVELHPVFTRPADWTGDGKLDGIEALVELRDSFGDTTKGAGRFVFELYAFRELSTDPRGQRISGPWVGDVSSPEDQRLRWGRTSRSYNFRLELPKVDPATRYVLTVSFESTGRPRLFDRQVIDASPVSSSR